MAKDPTLQRVEVDLVPSQWTRSNYPNDPPDWVTIMVPAHRISISSLTIDAVIQGPSLMIFKLKPTTPAPNSPTDTTWTIVRWEETRLNL